MPIRVLLEKMRRSDYLFVVECATHEDDSVGQLFIVEAAGHADRRQTAQARDSVRLRRRRRPRLSPSARRGGSVRLRLMKQ